MSWGYVVAGVVTAVSSAYSQSQNNKRLEAQANQENEARAETNLKNKIRAGYRTGLVNLQQGIYKKNAAQQGFDMAANRAEALGQVNANAAASGTIGSSVDAVAQDIDIKIGSLEARQRDDFDLAMFNFQVQRDEIRFERKAGELGDVQALTSSDGEIATNAVLSGVGTFAAGYAGSKMRLGAN